MSQLQNQTQAQDPLIRDLLQAFDNLFGLHPGSRPVHAKGVFCLGTFSPSSAARNLSSALHLQRASTPVVVRFSDFAGVPTVGDNDLKGAGPRGMAIRFQLGDHVHTDIIAHSANGFPVRTGEEFLEFAQAAAASPPEAPKPTPIESFLATHPATKRFEEIPKPIPTSFARESYFAVSAFRFTNPTGNVHHGRYRIVPEEGNEYVDPALLSEKSPNFLVDEMSSRLAQGPVKFRIIVQVAAAEDEVNDATIAWPESREQIELGTLTLTKLGDSADPELRKLIFDPIPRLEGIAPSDDPLFAVRADLYLLSGRRRRKADAAK